MDDIEPQTCQIDNWNRNILPIDHVPTIIAKRTDTVSSAIVTEEFLATK